MKRRGGKFPAVEKPEAAPVDADVFTREMRDVVPLEPDPRGRVRRAPPVRPADRPPPPPPTPDVDLTSRNVVTESGFVAAGVDRREIRKLKRGDHIVRDRSDLHGMTAAEARASVARLIENSRHSGHRCICIVHGRGLHSPGNAPILKASVRDYLRSHQSVLAYADAPASDGGPGAVYVLLRK